MMSDPPIQPENTRIPARSRRQAMDWSLALVSQGIETVIAPPEDGGQWGLIISARDSQRALQTLRIYHAENRGWPWQHHLPWTAARFDWTCLAWAAVLMLLHAIASANTGFFNAGIMDSTRVMSGQWWRIFTAMTLHADAAHLAENLAIGIVLFGLAMGRFGTGTGLLAAYLAGAGGNVASLMINSKPFQGLGASGMIMGALGLLAAQSLRPESRKHTSWKVTLGGLVGGVMLFVLFGVTPGTDVAAHFGGFVSGVILGTGLALLPHQWKKKMNVASGSIFSVLVVLTWWLALIHHGR